MQPAVMARVLHCRARRDGLSVLGTGLQGVLGSSFPGTGLQGFPVRWQLAWLDERLVVTDSCRGISCCCHQSSCCSSVLPLALGLSKLLIAFVSFLARGRGIAVSEEGSICRLDRRIS